MLEVATGLDWQNDGRGARVAPSSDRSKNTQYSFALIKNDAMSGGKGTEMCIGLRLLVIVMRRST